MISGLTADAVIEHGDATPDLAVRKAGMHDIRPILQLINGYAAKGIMLPAPNSKFRKTYGISR